MARWRKAGLAGVCGCLLLGAASAAPVRIVTWNLQPRDTTQDGTVQEAARVLKGLNPDVIILQQVPDVLHCEEILRALQPADYQVAVFSSFRNATNGDLSGQQVAILSREKATNPTWNSWQPVGQAAPAPGGFAAAIVHLEDRNLTVYGVQLSDSSPPSDAARETAAQQAARENATRQLVQEFDASRESAGGAQALVVGGDFNTTLDDPLLAHEMTLVRLERAGFSNALADLPLAKRVTLPGDGKRADADLDYIFTRDVARISNVQVVPVNLTLRNLVAVDLNFETIPVQTTSVPASATNQATATTPVPTGETTSSTDAAAGSAESAPSFAAFWQTLVKQLGVANIWWLGGLLGAGLILVIIGSVKLARRNRAVARAMRFGDAANAGAGEMMVLAPATPMAVADKVGPATTATSMAPMASGQMDAQAWKRRAEQAERRAEQATDAVRRGVIGQLSRWLQGGAAKKLVSERAQLLEAQRVAALKIQGVDERLTRVEQQIQQRTREYERRIGELEKELVEAREENRALIREKIAQVRAEMERERARLMQFAGAE
jgi:endonuclease/exonuclease/phosphatase family metal-dependent hydrolase